MCSHFVDIICQDKTVKNSWWELNVKEKKTLKKAQNDSWAISCDRKNCKKDHKRKSKNIVIKKTIERVQEHHDRKDTIYITIYIILYSVTCNLQIAIYNLQFTSYNSQLITCNSQLITHNTQLITHNSQQLQAVANSFTTVFNL